MKKTIILIATLMAFLSTQSTAAEKSHKTEMTPGMKVYKKKMRKGCRQPGLRFTKTHTKDEWEFIKGKGMLRMAAKEICPKLDTSKISNKEWELVYNFVQSNASDNPVIPSC